MSKYKKNVYTPLTVELPSFEAPHMHTSMLNIEIADTISLKAWLIVIFL